MSMPPNSAVLGQPRSPDPWGLSDTQYLIARWYGEGFSVKEIAEKMKVSYHTVYCHLERAQFKAEAESYVHLAVLVALNEAGVEFAS